MSIRVRVSRHPGATINTEGDTTMQYCLLMHYQEGGEIGLTEEEAGRPAAAGERLSPGRQLAAVER